MVMKIEKTWIPFISEVITAVAARVSIAEYVVYKNTSVHHLDLTCETLLPDSKEMELIT